LEGEPACRNVSAYRAQKTWKYINALIGIRILRSQFSIGPRPVICTHPIILLVTESSKMGSACSTLGEVNMRRSPVRIKPGG